MASIVREGGRAGFYKVDLDERRGQLEWEMRVGALDLAIYGESCWWTSPEQRKMSRIEVRALAREIALREGARIDLVFPEGSEIVEAK